MIEFKIIEYLQLYKLNILYYCRGLLVLLLISIIYIDNEHIMPYIFFAIILYSLFDHYLNKYKIIGNIVLTSNQIEIIKQDEKSEFFTNKENNLNIKIEYRGNKGELSNGYILFYALRFGMIPDSNTHGRDGIGTIYIEQNGNKLKYKILSENDCDEELNRLKFDIEANGGKIIILRSYIDILKSRFKLKF
jgi:hypothetical protein